MIYSISFHFIDIEYIDSRSITFGTALAIKYKNPPEQAGRYNGARKGDSEILRSVDVSSTIQSLFGGKK